MRLEGQAVVNGNLITQVEIVPGEDLPILLLAHLADNNLVVYYNDLFPCKFCLTLDGRVGHHQQRRRKQLKV